MSERRMFTKKITDADAFTSLPPTTQAFYFHLCMNADDDGFNNKIRQAMFNAHADQNDYNLLVQQRFIIPFESGIIVIKHWKLHNIIRNDRYHETEYVDEKARLVLKENGVYTESDNQVTTKCQPSDNQMETEVRLGKVSIGKDSIDKTNKAAKRFSDDDALNEAIKDFVDHRKKLRKPMTDRAIELFIKRLETLCPDNTSGQVELIQTAIERGWQTVYPSKETHAEPKKPNSKLQELEALYLEE